jgi:hypothetical protein
VGVVAAPELEVLGLLPLDEEPPEEDDGFEEEPEEGELVGFEDTIEPVLL